MAKSSQHSGISRLDRWPCVALGVAVLIGMMTCALRRVLLALGYLLGARPSPATFNRWTRDPSRDGRRGGATRRRGLGAFFGADARAVSVLEAGETCHGEIHGPRRESPRRQSGSAGAPGAVGTGVHDAGPSGANLSPSALGFERLAIERRRHAPPRAHFPGGVTFTYAKRSHRFWAGYVSSPVFWSRLRRVVAVSSPRVNQSPVM